jgi:cytochrome b561
MSSMLKNTTRQYGAIAKVFHWLTAVVVVFQCALGIWMVELDYYDAWYTQAPHIHKSIGILFALMLMIRLTWRFYSPAPLPLSHHSRLEKSAARATHWLIYATLWVIIVSGYLISSADGRAIEVFSWFEVLSFGELIDQQEDIAGDIHEWIAYALIVLVSLHALAALKHHFIDKDNTLKRMF